MPNAPQSSNLDFDFELSIPGVNFDGTPQFVGNILNNPRMLLIKNQTNSTVIVATAVGAAIAITGATAANPVDITANQNYITGTSVYFTGVGGMTQLNGNSFSVTSEDSSGFTILANGSAFSNYTSGGDVYSYQGTTMVAGESIILDCNANHGIAASLSFPIETSFYVIGPSGATGYVKISSLKAL